MTKRDPMPSWMTRGLVTAVALVLTIMILSEDPVAAQIAYDVAFPNAIHHEAEISLQITEVPFDTLELRMSRSSPGRYALHEFAKNVYDVRATNGEGHPLPVTRPNPYQWNVTGHDGTVHLTYTLFADRGDGTYAQVDDTHAHLNLPATFMWARGLEDREIRVTFRPPAGSSWKVATQLAPTSDPYTFTAPDLQYFLDSPTELSDFVLREWTVDAEGKTHTIRLAVHHLGADSDVDEYAEMVRRVVDTEIAVFGEPPDFDFGTYTFIADYHPWASGDGMEHRNSTILASRRDLARGARGLIGTVSHEFFHAWNVERIRPRSLEPFDFERANMSGELWFAEGFTSYYTPVFLVRAGVRTLESFAQGLANGLSTVINSPARRFFSPVEMSMQAPFVDAATAVDPTNQTNTFISYYTWGSVVGLALDLTLRTRFDLSLDDYMRLVWRRHGKAEIPYTVGDLERVLGDLTEDPGFAEEFFARYIRGRDVADYASLLSHAGMILRPANPGAAFLGLVQLDFDEAGAVVTSNTQIGSPLYEAGVDRGDRILALAGRRLGSDADWQRAKRSLAPGDVIDMEVDQRGRRNTVSLTVAEDPRLEVVTFERANRPVTDLIRGFRSSWLGTPD